MSQENHHSIDQDDSLRERMCARLSGTFLVLEGPDGCGKSTQANLLQRYLSEGGADVVRVREPGVTEIGEVIRELVLSPAFDGMALECELFLFMASRAQLVREVITPALMDGYTVIADRFLASTIAYQGGNQQIAREYDFPYVPIRRIMQIARVALGYEFPDYKTFVFDIDPDVSLRRMHSGEIARHGGRALHSGRSQQLFLFGDKIEHRAAQYQLKVMAMYQQMVENYPGKYIGINATGDVKSVFRRLLQELCRSFHIKKSKKELPKPKEEVSK